MTNEQKIPTAELDRIDQAGKKIYPDWYTEYDEGRAFNGYIRGARAEFLRHLNSKPSGLRWVKASERLPEKYKKVPIRSQHDHPLFTVGCVSDSKEEWGTDDNVLWFFYDTEWLDENPFAPIVEPGNNNDKNKNMTPTRYFEWEATKEKAKALIAAGGCAAIKFWSNTDAIRLCPKDHAKELNFQPLEGIVYISEWEESALLAIELISRGLELIKKTVEPAAETEKETGYVNSDRYIPMTSGDPDKSDDYLRKLVREAHNRETELMKKAIIMRDCYNDYISVLIRPDRTIEMSAKQREALCEALKPFNSISPSPPSIQQEPEQKKWDVSQLHAIALEAWARGFAQKEADPFELFEEWFAPFFTGDEAKQEAIPEDKTLGRILKEARVAKRMSVENVLEATGVSNEYLRKLEADELKSPSASVLWKLAQYYGIDLKPLAVKAGIIIKAPSPPSSGHIHVQLSGGAIANVSPDVSPELLDALNTMTKMAMQTVDPPSVKTEREHHGFYCHDKDHGVSDEKCVSQCEDCGNESQPFPTVQEGERPEFEYESVAHEVMEESGINDHVREVCHPAASQKLIDHIRIHIDSINNTSDGWCDLYGREKKRASDLQSHLYNSQQEKETLRQEVLAAKVEIDQLNQWRKEGKAYAEMLEEDTEIKEHQINDLRAERTALKKDWNDAKEHMEIYAQAIQYANEKIANIKKERDDYRGALEAVKHNARRATANGIEFTEIGKLAVNILDKYPIPQTPTNE